MGYAKSRSLHHGLFEAFEGIADHRTPSRPIPADRHFRLLLPLRAACCLLAFRLSNGDIGIVTILLNAHAPDRPRRKISAIRDAREGAEQEASRLKTIAFTRCSRACLRQRQPSFARAAEKVRQPRMRLLHLRPTTAHRAHRQSRNACRPSPRAAGRWCGTPPDEGRFRLRPTTAHRASIEKRLPSLRPARGEKVQQHRMRGVECRMRSTFAKAHAPLHLAVAEEEARSAPHPRLPPLFSRRNGKKGPACLHESAALHSCDDPAFLPAVRRARPCLAARRSP